MITKLHRSHVWAGALVLLIAAALRLGGFPETLIGYDQSTILSGAADLVSLRGFPLIGMKSSIGVMQTATPVYLAALALSLVHKVSAIKWLFSVLDILALAYLYQAVGRVYGRRAALITGLLYATNPWIIEYNRWIWYQTLLPTFATAAFAALLVILTAKRSSQGTLTLAMVAAVLMGTVHVVGLPWAGLLLLLCFVLAWRRQWWCGFFWGTGVALLIGTPYLVYLAKTSFDDVSLLLRSGGGESGGWNQLALRMTRELLTGREVFSTFGSSLWADHAVDLPLLTRLFFWILIVAVFSLLYRAIRQGNITPRCLFPLLWTVLAPGIFLHSSVHTQHFYLLFLFPAPFVLVGSWLQRVDLPYGLRLFKGLCLGFVLLLTAWWIYIWGVRIWDLERGRRSLAAWRMDRLVEVIDTSLETQPERDLILLVDFEGTHSHFAWVSAFSDDPERVRALSAERGFIIPAGEVCYMAGPGTAESDLWPVHEHLVLHPEMTIPGNNPWRFYCRSQPPSGPVLEQKPRWQHGVYFLDAQVAEALDPGETLDIIYRWYYNGATLQDRYHLFNHLWGDEQLATQLDGVRVPASLWRPGDQLLMYFQMPLPESLEARAYTLNVGFYPWPDIAPVPLQDGTSAYTVKTWTLSE